MDQPDLDALSAALRTVWSRKLADCSHTNGVFSGDRSRIEATVITLVARNDGTAVAFYALALMDAGTKHLSKVKRVPAVVSMATELSSDV